MRPYRNPDRVVINQRRCRNRDRAQGIQTARSSININAGNATGVRAHADTV